MHAFTSGDWGLLVAIALIWGSSFLFMEIGLRAFAPGVITLARVGLGAATLSLLPRARAPVDREDWPRIAFLGAIWIAIPLLIFPVAQQWTNSSVTGMINGAMPVFTVLWAIYLMRKLPGWRQLLGIGLGFVGMVLVFVPELEVGGGVLIGALLVVVAVAFYGLASNLSVPLSQKYGSLPLIWRAELVALVIVAPVGLWQLP